MIKKIFRLLRQWFREKRLAKIQGLIGTKPLNGWILDLGGGPASFFAAMFPRSDQVILIDVDLNLAREAKRRQPVLNVVVADGRQLPLASSAVELTVCNSVIEHVSSPERFASEILRVSQSYFVQTPNGNFPLEVHSFISIPFYGLIPWSWLKKRVCRLFRADFAYIDSVHYLSEQRLREIFLGATIAYEKVLGLTKSFYVYRFSGDGDENRSFRDPRYPG